MLGIDSCGPLASPFRKLLISSFYIKHLRCHARYVISLALLLLYTRSSDEHKGVMEMMLKITTIQESRNDVLIKLEGKITDQWAALLDGECRAYLRQKKAVHLDCSHVDFIDARGVEVLNNLPQTQVNLMSAPGFITELLQIGGRS
jgi:ABC-type transporter Mla MlaB component